MEEPKTRYTFEEDNTSAILKAEIGKVFAKVLEHAGVYKRIPEGTAAFHRFFGYVNRKGKA